MTDQLQVTSKENKALRWLLKGTTDPDDKRFVMRYVAGVRDDAGDTVLISTDGFQARLLRMYQWTTRLVGSCWDFGKVRAADRQIPLNEKEGARDYPRLENIFPSRNEQMERVIDVTFDVKALRALLSGMDGENIRFRLYRSKNEQTNLEQSGQVVHPIEFFGEVGDHPVMGMIMPRAFMRDEHWMPEGIDRPAHRRKPLADQIGEPQTEEDTDAAPPF